MLLLLIFQIAESPLLLNSEAQASSPPQIPQLTHNLVQGGQCFDFVLIFWLFFAFHPKEWFIAWMEFIILSCE